MYFSSSFVFIYNSKHRFKPHQQPRRTLTPPPFLPLRQHLHKKRIIAKILDNITRKMTKLCVF